MRESPQALEAWVLYRDLGPQRSSERVAITLGKSHQLIMRWCTAHAWVERARAHDQAIADAAAERDKTARVDRIAKMRETRLGLSVEMAHMGLHALRRKADQDKIGAYAAVQMIQLANETQRKDMDEPDSRVDVSGGLTIKVVYDDAPAPEPAP